jgi:hypothetical protein
MHKIWNFNEGHSNVGEWQGSGRVVAGDRQGKGMVCVNRPLDFAPQERKFATTSILRVYSI